MKLIRRPGLWIEKHITPCFRNLFQKMLCFAAQGQQALSLEDIPVPDIKIGPRQGEKFTLPQTAGQSCVDERECAKLFRSVQIPLELSKAQGSGQICTGLQGMSWSRAASPIHRRRSRWTHQTLLALNPRLCRLS